MGNVSGERKTCTRENSLQKLSEEPNKHICPKTKNGTTQYQLAGIYIKEQTEYIQNQIDKIRDSVEDRQSRIAWQTINKVSWRKSTAKAKGKNKTVETAFRKSTHRKETHRKLRMNQSPELLICNWTLN